MNLTLIHRICIKEFVINLKNIVIQLKSKKV